MRTGTVHFNDSHRLHLVESTAREAPQRIEALLLCQFLALLIGALIEREIRTAMAAAELDTIALYPELRSCPAPSATRILGIFTGIARHHLIDTTGRVIQIFEPTLTPLQHQVLTLLGIPDHTYTGTARPTPTPSSGGRKPSDECGTSGLLIADREISKSPTDGPGLGVTSAG